MGKYGEYEEYGEEGWKDWIKEHPTEGMGIGDQSSDVKQLWREVKRQGEVLDEIKRQLGELRQIDERKEVGSEADQGLSEGAETGRLNEHLCKLYEDQIEYYLVSVKGDLSKIPPGQEGAARIAVEYLGDKVPVFTNPNTSVDVQRHIAMFGILILGKAIEAEPDDGLPAQSACGVPKLATGGVSCGSVYPM